MKGPSSWNVRASGMKLHLPSRSPKAASPRARPLVAMTLLQKRLECEVDQFRIGLRRMKGCAERSGAARMVLMRRKDCDSATQRPRGRVGPGPGPIRGSPRDLARNRATDGELQRRVCAEGSFHTESPRKDSPCGSFSGCPVDGVIGSLRNSIGALKFRRV